MTRVVSLGVASSSPEIVDGFPRAILIPAGLNGPHLPESWEPPTPAEWRRAVRLLAWEAVRQMLHGGGDGGLRAAR